VLPHAGTEDLPNSKISRTTTEAQAGKRWEPPIGVLGDLLASAERRAKELEVRRATVAAQARSAASVMRLSDSLRAGSCVAIIGEVKRASPSRGAINSGLAVQQQVEAYERGNARAISILTEPESFGGSSDDLALAAKATSLPILRKDFHVSPTQLLEARALGAAAALLIARALPPARLAEMVSAANEIGLEPLVEVRTEDELEAALSCGAEMIGVNNRDLETLTIHTGTAARILPLIPEACVTVAESGYESRKSVELAAAAGADAVLIGSFLSASNDPVSALRSLVTVERRSRARSLRNQ